MSTLAFVIALRMLLSLHAYYTPSQGMNPTFEMGDRFIACNSYYNFKEPAYGDIAVFKAPAAWSLDGQERVWVKRVIGLPGDTIEVREGCMLVDGTEYSHRDIRDLFSADTNTTRPVVKLTKEGLYLDGKLVDPGKIKTALELPDAKLEIRPGAVLRNGEPIKDFPWLEDPNSSFPLLKVKSDTVFVIGDSINNSNDSRLCGLLERKRLLGKAMFVYWPLNRIRLLR